MLEKSLRIGVDIGGTFTDLVAVNTRGDMQVLKVPSTPENPSDAVVDGMVHLLQLTGASMGDVQEIVHGTTVGSNAILQKKGAVTGVLTTKGFRDVLEIGRIRTPVMFDLSWEKPIPLSPRRYRLEITERIGADGDVVTPINEEDVRKAGQFFVSERVEAVALCFLNSFKNAEHEKRAYEILTTEFPELHVSASFQVLPEIKEYERTSTTVVNAYLLKEMGVYLQDLTEKLQQQGLTAPIRVVTSSGGMITSELAAKLPVFVVGSGPAGGVVGGANLNPEGDAIMFDLGGTTAKASLIESGEPSVTTEYEFRDGISSPSRFVKGGGYMLKVPAIDIAEVGAGGGSIAWIDDGGMLRVGPVSVGADPGPACYNRGNNRPTVTDANVFLGLLDPAGPAGGTLSIDIALSEKAIRTKIADPLDMDIIKAAHGIRHIANLEMARAIRSVSVERGKDPRNMQLMASGGGGPVHAVELASILGMKTVCITPFAGVFCSLGMLGSQVEYSFVKTLMTPLTAGAMKSLQQAKNNISKEAYMQIKKENFDANNVMLKHILDVRYVGQSSEIMLPLPQDLSVDNIERAFITAYEDLYGYSTDDALEIVNIRLVARLQKEDNFNVSQIKHLIQENWKVIGERPVCLSVEKGFTSVKIYDRDHCGMSPLQGPAIIRAYDTTIVVPDGAVATAKTDGTIIITLC